jgi:zinc transport system substrate-binding protein
VAAAPWRYHEARFVGPLHLRRLGPRALASRRPPGRSRGPGALPLLPPEGGEDEGGAEEHHGGPFDPHVWLDLELDRTIVDRIAGTLSGIDPEGAGYFEKNAAAYKELLLGMDSRYREGLKDCSGGEFVVAGHAAFGYLARRYGLVQRSLFGLSPDSQATPKQMMKIVSDCRKAGIRTVFLENSVSPDLARTLATEIGGRVLVLSSGHNLTRDEMRRGVTFLDLMEGNLQSLRQGLGCR